MLVCSVNNLDLLIMLQISIQECVPLYYTVIFEHSTHANGAIIFQDKQIAATS